MDVTTAGRYRVLGRPVRDDEYLFVDLDDDYEPLSVEATDAPELEAGWLVEATLTWASGTASVRDCEVVERSRYRFYDGVTGMFEAARRTWAETASEGEAMGSRVTRDTDGEPAGALYVFAKQPGARDLYDELRTGATPVEPLVERVDEERAGADDGRGERAVFVMRPADEEFVCVYVVFERDGLLARTVRETYGVDDAPGALDVGGAADVEGATYDFDFGGE